MRLLKAYKIITLIVGAIACSQSNSTTICLTGRIVKSLPTYGESFVNGAYLARGQNKLTTQVKIKNYFYDNQPLEPVRVYNVMRNEGCSAIIGFEYLSDLLLVANAQNDFTIPIFTSYASTLRTEKLPKNIFVFMPEYNFLTQKMINFLNNRYGKIQNVLFITEVNRNEMLKYKDAYSALLNQENIKYDSFDFLENDEHFEQKLIDYLKHKKYKYVFLLSGTIASAKAADLLNDHNTIFIGTENYGSSINQSFYIRLKNKNITSFFIRNLDFLKTNSGLKSFQLEYTERYHSKPTLLSAYTYDATNIILKTLMLTDSLKSGQTGHINYQGVTGAKLKDGHFYRSNSYVILSVQKDGYKYEK